MIRYEARLLVLLAICLYFFRLGARRRLRFELRSTDALGNLNRLAATRQQKIPHDDTVAYLMKQMPPEGLRRVRAHMLRRMLRCRMLQEARLLGRYYLVAVDATGFLSFRRRHCQHCLTQRLSQHQTLYYHPVLEAKLITPGGLAISVATEFLQNTDPAGPQDCELSAFERLLPRLRSHLPRLPICLLLDAQYLNQTVMDLCQRHRLHWIITFKEGSLPQGYSEFETLTALAPHNHLARKCKALTRRYRWMGELEHAAHSFWAFECVEKKQGKPQPTRFLWATSLKVDRSNVEHLSLQGGRLRWKIENEGFNRQKNGGFALEHPYCENWNAAQNFYLALQIADLLSQLIEKSTLLAQKPADLFGSIASFALRLLEAWRNYTIPSRRLNVALGGRYQIRLAPT
jgi:hypothetical protein